MRHPSKRPLAAMLGLSLLAAAFAAAQSAPGTKPANPPQVAKADAAKDAPAKDVPAAAPKPEPVKYTELKKTPWPPKTGVKTPGVQIPVTNLKPEAEIPLAAAPGVFLFTTDQVLIPIPAQDQIARVESKSNKVLEPITSVTKPDSTKSPLGKPSTNGVTAKSRIRANRSFTVETRHVSGFESLANLFLFTLAPSDRP